MSLVSTMKTLQMGRFLDKEMKTKRLDSCCAAKILMCAQTIVLILLTGLNAQGLKYHFTIYTTLLTWQNKA
jgi:hypothetical protein